MPRLARNPRRTAVVSAAALILLGATAFVFWYDRAHPGPAASTGQVMLDTRLAGTTSATFSSLWPSVSGPTYLWERSTLTAGSAPTHSPCPPVLGDGHIYVASTRRQPHLYAYQLLARPRSPTQAFNWGISNLASSPAWASDWPDDVSVSGMAYADGYLYVGLDGGHFNSAMLVYQGTGGKLLGGVSLAASLVGPPVLATLPSGGKTQLAAFRRSDGTGGVWALDSPAKRVVWTANVAFHPIGAPAEAGGIVVVGGVDKNNRPEMAAFRLAGGDPLWRFESPRNEPGADDEWEPAFEFGTRAHSPRRGSVSGRRQPGGVAASADGSPGGGCACFACGRSLYAVDLLTGRPRWEQTPAIDPQTVGTVSAIVDGLPSWRPQSFSDPDAAELPRAPWVTAPSLHGDQVLFGTPEGLWAVAAGDGRQQWHLRKQEVGAVDVPPLIEGGIAYVVGQGWIGSDVIDARSSAAYAIRLDGPSAAPTLTASTGRLPHWPWLLVAAALAGLIVAAGERGESAARRRSRWLDTLPILAALAALALLAGWTAWGVRHHTLFPPSAPNGPFTYAEYHAPLPVAILFALLGISYAAGLLAAWRGQKLAVAVTLSLALVAAGTALWVRGKRTAEQVGLGSYELLPDRVLSRTFQLDSEMGGLRIERVEVNLSLANGLAQARDTQGYFWHYMPDPPVYPTAAPLRPRHERGFVHVWHGLDAQSRSELDLAGKSVERKTTSITVPDWLLFVPTGFLAATWLARAGLRWRTQRRRANTGHCLVCNYSLTGNISGTCPECGTPVRAAADGPPAAAACRAAAEES
jgi:outer membrane protein assembly factor BamB